jgi:hypothetical protein
MLHNIDQEQQPRQREVINQEGLGKVIGYTALCMLGLSIYAGVKYGTPNPIEALTLLTMDSL